MDRYRLAPVRDERDRAERIRRGDLAVAVGAATATERDVAEAAEQVERARTAIAAALRPEISNERAATGTTARELAWRDQFVGRLRRDLEARLAEHARCTAAHRGTLEQLDAARDRLTRARADRRVIEQHFERWRTERARIADRRAD